MVRIGQWIVHLTSNKLTLSLRLLNREEGTYMVMTEVTGIVECEVDLVVVRTDDITAQIVAVSIRQTVEVGF